MTTLRCTAKFLKRFGVERPPDPPPGDNVLGDWYANILFLKGAHVLLCVSERSRLPVVASARWLRDFPSQFPRLVGDILAELGVPSDAADRERGRMIPMAFGPTRSRSVLGTLNDFAAMLKVSWNERPDLSLFDWSLRLAETPCSPLDGRRPRDVTLELLAPQNRFRVIRGGSGRAVP
ncbi:MAG: hypothetical protein SCH98_08455 [Deferrisomatales bacterium]|nr:hypothetical protein [Deferrisomatales bacterium]